ncbi:MAG TPA: UDP-N-acetylmuramoyl-tripeptide--D-alanyl-D-alanine ligase [Candidatus Paceibacterota bacterium]
MKNIFKKIVVAILTWEAKVALGVHKPKVIAVTGNVGKTSTKDAIYAVVSRSFNARKSQKSMNSEFGLPLTILGLDTAWSSAGGWAKNLWKGFVVALFRKNYPEWLVLEVGADHPGDIESVAKWLSPEIVVLTRMSDVPVHVQFFKDAADVLREKMFLAQALRPDGALVVNADDPLFMKAVADLNATKGGTLRVVTYGQDSRANTVIADTHIEYGQGALPLPTGQGAKIGGENVVIRGVLGSHLMYSVAAASAVASVLGIQKEVAGAFADFETPKGRMRILPGALKSAIIDDTYNSSPIACAEALKALGGLSIRGRKMAALADMKELGDNTESAHRNIGKLAFEHLHTLVTVGEAAKFIALGARDAGMTADRIHSFATSEEAAAALADMVRAGDVVLVKGSQSMRMERVSKALLEDQSQAGKLLVRQEEEWSVR